MTPKRRHAAGSRRAAPPGRVPSGPASSRRLAHPARRFLLRFAGVASALFLAYRFSEEARLFRHVNELNALLCSLVLRGFGVPNSRSGTTLQMASGGFDVISECSAVYAGILYAAAVGAFPAAWRSRIQGLAGGLAILFGVNVLRLASLGAILQHRPAWMPWFHEYLWQVLFIGLVAAIYVAWLERNVRRGPAHPTA
jgi:exosortase H (IPTLxxWG-CTERM-specific)